VSTARGAETHFSAVCYFFGRRLQRTVGVPIGLIQAAVGGSTVESWISGPTLLQTPDLTKAARILAAQVKHEEGDPSAPDYKGITNRAPAGPSTLFNGMIAPLTRYPMKGVVWYQGESNVGRQTDYVSLLTALIGDWRQIWGISALPFLIVQLPGFGKPEFFSIGSTWAQIREQQAAVARTVPNVALVVTVDMGAADLHPKLKRPIGDRLANAALALAYGEQVSCVSPTMRSWSLEHGSVRIEFDGAERGLETRAGVPAGFVVAGQDGKWCMARGRIVDSSVIVTCPEVSQPVAVRYAWADRPLANIFSGCGLPAAPFRTDSASTLHQ
jgi:sialate O-acetylesterase